MAFKDSELIHLEDDIQKIQVKTNMYINEYGEQGAFHLAREIIQNNIDECIDKDSPGNTIDITYDIATDIMSATDNGRSFNESKYPMKVFCTTLQSGSKFFRESGSDSAGEFGVGLSVCNALSDYFKMIAYRTEENTVHTIEFSEGVLVKDEIKPNKKGKQGTTVEFRVSKKYMGEDAKLPIDDVINWLNTLFYLRTDKFEKKGIKASITVYDGMTLKKTVKFKPKPFYDLLSKIIPADVKKKDLSDLVHISGDTSLMEDSKILKQEADGTTAVVKKKLKKDIHMDVAFQYVTSVEHDDSAVYDTYCNFTNTINNGSHLDAFDEAYCRYIQYKAMDSMSENQRSKMKVTWDDIRTNLYCIVSLSTNAYVGFVGNAKNQIMSPKLVPYMKDLITSKLDEFFKANPKILEDIIKIVKINVQARMEALKAKSATQVERLNTFKEHKLILCSISPFNCWERLRA